MDKILEKFKFKQYESYDIAEIKKYVKKFSDEWFFDTTRQETYSIHKNTMSYFLYEADLDWVADTPYIVEQKSNDEVLLAMVEPIVKSLEELHNGKRGQVLFIKLPGKNNIPKHHDDGDYLMSARRHHVPIITNKKTIFGVSNETVNMQEGECWEINNSKMHYVTNDSTVDRIHLLIDIMPNEFIK